MRWGPKINTTLSCEHQIKKPLLSATHPPTHKSTLKLSNNVIIVAGFSFRVCGQPVITIDIITGCI